MARFRRTHRGPDRGQATVELAIVLPFIVLLAAALIQCGLIVVDQLAVWTAARSAARAAAISSDPLLAAQRAANDAVGIRPLHVTISSTDDVVSAHVMYIDHTNLPIIGLFFPEISLQATVAMWREVSTQ
ncbi:MAG: TadE family protein [Ilumatobacteraceae bacterium]